MSAIHTAEYKGHTIEIIPDEMPESPRDWDNLGKMLCFHRRYDLGDKLDLNYEDDNGYHSLTSEDFGNWQELHDWLVKEQKAVVVLPLYLYDHSGLYIKVGSWQGMLSQGHAEFDSGQVGFIYATRESVLNEFSTKRITNAILQKVVKGLSGEVETYAQYLTGDIYGYVVKDEKGEEQDSCWGYYGMDAVLEEAKSVIDYRVEKAHKEHEAKLKAQIMHRAPLSARM